MIYLILSIVFSTITVSFFKIFEIKKVDTFLAIVFNYLTCCLVGTYFSSHKIYQAQVWQSEWIWITAGLGFLFISIFYFIALTAQKISMSASMVSAKLSVVIPVLVAYFFYNEQMGWVKSMGIICSLIAVYFISNNEKDKAKNGHLFYLPMVVFVGSGLIDTLLKYLQTNYVPAFTAEDIVTATFFFAGSFGLVFLSIQVWMKKIQLNLKSVLWGVLLGIPNYFSMYFLVETLSRFESTFIFPINNIGIVAGSTLLAFLAFKENLTRKNMLGLLLSILAILLISFS
ncbi:MAG: EamA family transporter [bacterium]|nr:EamA family transporter [bacterium]